MHDGAVGGDDEIGGAALDFLQHGQAATASAGFGGENGDVAGAVADEGVLAGRQVGDDDFAGLALGYRPAILVDDFDDDVLGRQVHAALRALVGDEAGIAATVAVGDLAAEDAGDVVALVIVEALRGDERDLDAEIVHRLAAFFGMTRDQR